MKHYATLAVLFFFLLQSFSASSQCNATKPKNLLLTDQTGCTATLHWKSIPNIGFYSVKYRAAGTTKWKGQKAVGTDTIFTFSGLLPNTQYTFAVASYCSFSASSGFSKINGDPAPCSPPQNVSATINSGSTVTFSWSSCGASAQNQLRYKPSGAISWTYVFTGSFSTATVTIAGTTSIVYEATACSDTAGNWSAPATLNFSTQHKPNAIVVLLDDSRYDSYSCNGAPSFFQSPNIDRVANEGVNFKNTFVIFSLCNPSRASILTGLYANHNGAYNNKDLFYSYLPTISTVMDQFGYYTAFMGKYLNANDDNPVPQPGWNYWMARIGSGHKNANFNLNGSVKNMKGHVTDVLTDTAVAVINRISEPFLIYICYSATHSPYVPRDADKHLFENIDMPLPDNYYKYTNNYPNFLYTSTFSSPDSAVLKDDIRGYYQVMAGVDEDLIKIFNALEAKNIMDSTLIMFTSDNGYLMGEHSVQGKRLPYEESMRVPMFIRYPQWFPQNSVVTDQVALNIDIAPTLFELAGAPDTFQLDGISMHELFNGSKERSAFYYQATHLNDSAVNCRSVRSLDYKYNYYYCNNTTEEFFNLSNDPEENTNLINDSGSAALIQQYRNKEDSFKIAIGDDIVEDISNCKIVHPLFTRTADDEYPVTGFTFTLYPNPASDVAQLRLDAVEENQEADLTIYNMKGSITYRQLDIVLQPGISVPVDLSKLEDGLYNIELVTGGEVMNKKLLIIH
jgi:N-acetylglucosamine-6-sulfatase